MADRTREIDPEISRIVDQTTNRIVIGVVIQMLIFSALFFALVFLHG